LQKEGSHYFTRPIIGHFLPISGQQITHRVLAIFPRVEAWLETMKKLLSWLTAQEYILPVDYISILFS